MSLTECLKQYDASFALSAMSEAIRQKHPDHYQNLWSEVLMYIDLARLDAEACEQEIEAA